MIAFRQIQTQVKRKPKKQKSPRQLIIKANDDLLREIIRKRDNYTCQWSGKKDNLQVAHFFTRSALTTRWDLDNLVTLNAGIHLFKAHKYPEQFRDWWIKRIGAEKFEQLKIRNRCRGPVTLETLRLTNLYLHKLYAGEK